MTREEFSAHCAAILKNLCSVIDGKDAEELQLRPAEWYEDHRVDVHVGERVLTLDLDGGRAQLASTDVDRHR